VVASLAYKSTAREKNFQRIAIVDDTFTRGVTVAATVIHLRQHGLPEECHIVVACPLWLDTVKPAASLA
jgi:predicted amidophosphoribosyltransferase